MNKKTIKRLNRTIFGYLSIIGLSGEDKMSIADNPVFNYFTHLVFQSGKNDKIIKMMSSKTPTTNSFDDMPNIHDEFMEIDIPSDISISKESFHSIIREIFNIYKKVDDIKLNQNSDIKESLIDFIGSERDFNNYIDETAEHFKNSFYKLIKYYNSPNETYLKIKIRVLTDKMMEYVEIEDYLKAAELKEKIEELKNKY